MALVLPSFAKINWDLRILGRRPDGFHELDTVFQTIDLCDSLEFELCEGGITLEISGRELSAGPDNLVVRCAEAYQDRLGERLGLRMRLEKRIPLGAGLGGGSSNAAVTLLALSRLAPGVGEKELQEIAAAAGSDVPFFLQGGLAWGRGRGEVIEVLPDEGVRLPVLVVWPGFPVATAEAYRRLAPQPPADLTLARPDHTMRHFPEALRGGRWFDLRNDLERPILSAYPVLGRLKQMLLEHGCALALLSGSGSALFATGEVSSLERAGEWCRQHGWGEVGLYWSVPRAEYRRRLGLNA